jgi:hypothetical protein
MKTQVNKNKLYLVLAHPLMHALITHSWHSRDAQTIPPVIATTGLLRSRVDDNIHRYIYWKI